MCRSGWRCGTSTEAKDRIEHHFKNKGTTVARYFDDVFACIGLRCPEKRHDATVERDEHIVAGDRRCAYRIARMPAAQRAEAAHSAPRPTGMKPGGVSPAGLSGQ